MHGQVHCMIGFVALVVIAGGTAACTPVLEQTRSTAAAVTQPAAPQPEIKGVVSKAVEVEGVISAVGQRTITFQLERKGRVREAVVGVDDKTNIEKNGKRVKLGDLQQADKALINYEPEAYTPALGIKVIGKGEVKKVGGED